MGKSYYCWLLKSVTMLRRLTAYRIHISDDRISINICNLSCSYYNFLIFITVPTGKAIQNHLWERAFTLNLCTNSEENSTEVALLREWFFNYFHTSLWTLYLYKLSTPVCLWSFLYIILNVKCMFKCLWCVGWCKHRHEFENAWIVGK